MKQLLILICITLSLCSCHIVKKLTKKAETHTDSTGTKSSSVVDLKKIDSTGTATTATNSKKTTEGGYKKTTTTIRETFSDEFGDEDSVLQYAAKVQKGDTTHLHGPGGFIYLKPKLKARETTTTVEEGTQKAIEETEALQEIKGKISGVDSFTHDQKETVQKTANTQSDNSSKSTISLLPWWLWLILIIVVAGLIYLHIKLKLPWHL